jgi:hypothetical protein
MAVTSPIALLSGSPIGPISDALKNIAPTSSAKSGDATSGPVENRQASSFAQSSPFNVGSGSASGSADSGASAGGSNAMLYFLAAAAVVVGVIALSRSGR